MLAEGSVLVAHNLSVGYKSRFIKTDTIQGYQAANIAFRTNSKRSKWEIESSNGNNSHRGRNKTTTTTTLSSSSSSSSHPPQHQQQQQPRTKVNRITLQIQSSYYDDIQSGAKQWEGRLYQPNYHGKLIPGDEILLKCRNKKELLVTIEQVQLFNGSATENGEAGEGPFEKMLNYCGLKAMLPRVESLQKGIELYRSFPNYRQKEYQRGAIAFKIVKKV